MGFEGIIRGLPVRELPTLVEAASLVRRRVSAAVAAEVTYLPVPAYARVRPEGPGSSAAMLLLSASAVLASNPFTTTVVPLTPGNWSALERSPHLWMVNVCRQS